MALPSTNFTNTTALSANNLANISATIPATYGELISNSSAKTELENKIDSLSGVTGGLGPNVGSIVGGGIVSGIGNLVTGTIGGIGGAITGTIGNIGNIATGVTGALGNLASGNFQAFAGSISSAAGQLNDLLSLKRGANLPSGGALFAQVGTPITMSPSDRNDWRVRINAPWEIFNSKLFEQLENSGGVVWPYLPNVSITTKANYTNPDVVHNNYAFQAYKNSQIEEITITGEFTCETEVDAAYWIAATTFFKTATKMFFGTGDHVGNPPIICNLSGYGRSVLNSIPVVIKSFNVDLKDNVNYIRCDKFQTSTWVPIISTITVVVSPVYNRTTIRKFDMKDYAAGKTLTEKGIGYL